MSVATYTRPDFTESGIDASTYKARIDGGFMVAERLAMAFAPHAQDTPDMSVKVDAGAIFDGITLTEVSAQDTASFTAPSSNPRIDRIVINRLTGAVSVIAGTEAASPSAPSITAGTKPVAQVLLQTTTTMITNSMITDERSPVSSGWSLISSQNASAATSVSFTGLSTGVRYKLVFEVDISGTGSLFVRFNGDSGANYDYAILGLSSAAASVSQSDEGATEISLHEGATGDMHGSVEFQSSQADDTIVGLFGQNLIFGGSCILISNAGQYDGASDLTSVQFHSGGTATFTGRVSLYQLIG